MFGSSSTTSTRTGCSCPGSVSIIAMVRSLAGEPVSFLSACCEAGLRCRAQLRRLDPAPHDQRIDGRATRVARRQRVCLRALELGDRGPRYVQVTSGAEVVVEAHGLTIGRVSKRRL